MNLLQFDNLTIMDCLELYEIEGFYFEINDGHIVAVGVL